jgi:class 3 adenylate cyclase/tetratricopeptide (TPR) repeat protein
MRPFRERATGRARSMGLESPGYGPSRPALWDFLVRGAPNTRKFDCYVPRVLLKRLVVAPEDLVETLEGTMVFVDVSGFTRLSERLARRGREGAEHLTDAINACFSALLADAYANGGSLLKFGGDALLLWFDGDDHPLRACTSAAAMRNTIRRAGRIRAAGSHISLRMSAGVHTGNFHMFLVGKSHREYLIAGPHSSKVVEMEAAAAAGQVLLSPQTAAMLPRRALGGPAGPGVLLARSPSKSQFAPEEEIQRPDHDAIIRCLSTEVRTHVLAAPAAPEHRTAVVAFVQFGELDELINARGPAAAAEQLAALVEAVEEAADLFQVCFLGSDVAADGGKLILTAGAPRAVGDDEERMLLTLRHIVEHWRALPVRIGVNRGRVFAGEIGPHYRRTYSVMGDTVNVAARLMAKAPWESVYATEGVLTRSQTRFELSRLEPLTVKGKAHPIEAWEVGPLARARDAHAGKPVPLVGRDPEYATLCNAVVQAERSQGSLVEVIGETGSGKSRLLAEARDLAGGFRSAHTTCENYRRSVPYVVWRDILRQLLGLRWDDPDEVVLGSIREHIEMSDRRLLPWLPLLAIPFDVRTPMTREVRDLAPDYRTTKLHEIVLQFLEPLLAVRTLIQIEHAHFMDEASAALLHAIAKRLTSSAWVITVTRRDVDGGFIGTPESSTQLVLGPLPAQAMLTLAESTPEASRVLPHVLALAIERAGGSPEFLLDLLAAAAEGSDELPDSLEAAASARIDELDPDDRVLVRRASVLGLCFHQRLLHYVLDASVPEPDEHTWSRISSVFADDGDGYKRFKRPAMREVAYESLPFRLRRQLHAAVGEALEPDLGRDADADPALLSLHFILAGEYQRAWRYARIGAERASARFAHADAARLYRRAIEAGREARVSDSELAHTWEALGEALRQAGERAAAAAAFTSARRLVAGDAIAEARLLFCQAQIAERSERATAAVRWVRRGLVALDGRSELEARQWRARLIADLAGIRQRQGRYRDAERLCREAISEAKATGELLAEARACYTLDWALVELARPDEAVYSARALEIYRALGDNEHESKVLNNLGGLAYWRGRWDEAVALYRQAGARSKAAGNPADVAYTDCNVGEILSDQGHLEEAARHLQRARRVWTSTGDRQGAAYAAALLGRLRVRAGEISDGLALLTQAAKDMRGFGLQQYAEFADALVAEGEALGGDPDRAVALTRNLLARGAGRVSMLRRVCGVALARAGHRGPARRELELAVDAARAGGEEHELAMAIDALSVVAHVPNAVIRERDIILDRLGVVRLASTPIGPEGIGAEDGFLALVER